MSILGIEGGVRGFFNEKYKMHSYTMHSYTIKLAVKFIATNFTPK
jgi:hypothetical protein